jgi:hypothetical protein
VHPCSIKIAICTPLPFVVPQATGLEEALHLSLGACLIHSAVFRALKQPYFREGVGEDKVSIIGDDVLFFHEARKAGFVAMVDHALSRDVGHIAETVLRFPGPE